MTTDRQPDRRRRTLYVVLGGLVVVLIAAGAGLVWFFNRSVPEAASIESALGAVSDSTTTTSAAAPGTTTGSVVSLDGAWAVDTSVGTFSFEEATASFAGFRIQEELRGLGSTTAVGRTPSVSGTIELSGSTVTSASFEADLTAIITNDSRRDSRVQSALDTRQFPTASFTTTAPIDFGAVPVAGQTVSVTATGDLTIHGVTRPVEIRLEARLVDDLIIVVGSTELVFADYGVAVPTAPIVLAADDNGILEVQLWFRKSSSP